jgi:uncharacterized protein (TIGR02145 family)
MKIKSFNIQKSIIIIIILFNLNLNLFSQTGTSINTTGASADISAMLDISSTSQGLLIPRITTNQRDNIVSPATSLLIFNTTTNCFEAYVNNGWYTVSCPTPCSPPSVPSSGINIPSDKIIIWNWNTISGATGYKWNTANTYSTANDNGTSVSYTQSGFNCNTSYSIYVWAYNICGNSPGQTLAQTTSSCIPTTTACGSQVFMLANLNVGTKISGGTQQTSQGVKWCYNDLEANCTTYGGLYQWAEAMGPSYSNTAITNPIITCDPCGPASGKGGAQGICPAGYHIPSDLEWSRYEYCLENTISPTGSTPLTTFQNQSNPCFRGSTSYGVGPGDKMKVTASNTPIAWDGTNTSGFTALPAGEYQIGGFYNISTQAFFRSATELGVTHETNAWSRFIMSGSSQSCKLSNLNDKVWGLSVRCMQD